MSHSGLWIYHHISHAGLVQKPSTAPTFSDTEVKGTFTLAQKSFLIDFLYWPQSPKDWLEAAPIFTYRQPCTIHHSPFTFHHCRLVTVGNQYANAARYDDSGPHDPTTSALSPLIDSRTKTQLPKTTNFYYRFTISIEQLARGQEQLGSSSGRPLVAGGEVWIGMGVILKRPEMGRQGKQRFKGTSSRDCLLEIHHLTKRTSADVCIRLSTSDSLIAASQTRPDNWLTFDSLI